VNQHQLLHTYKYQDILVLILIRTYVATARLLAPNYFRFYFADIGPTKEWGYPRLFKIIKKINLIIKYHHYYQKLVINHLMYI